MNECANRVDEIREFVRCEIESDINLFYLNDPKKSFSGRTIDISRGGMKIVLDQEVSSGDRLCLGFKLPGINHDLDL